MQFFVYLIIGFFFIGLIWEFIKWVLGCGIRHFREDGPIKVTFGVETESSSNRDDSIKKNNTSDDDEGRLYELPYQLPVAMGYTSGKGDYSERTVTPKLIEMYDNGTIRIHAWCHKRQANRTFINQRINWLSNPETGEVYENVSDFVESLKNNIEKIDNALEDIEDDIITLVAMAKADRKFADSEMDFIIKHITSQKPELEAYKEQLREVLRSYMPNADDFLEAVGRIKNDSPKGDEIYNILYELAAVDGKVTPKEQEKLAMLKIKEI